MTGSIQVIHEHSEDIPVVELRHILRSGAALEPEGLEGVGRIALRLLRRGAGGKGRAEMDEAVDRIAAILSAQASADFYGLHVRVLRKHLEAATDILAQVLLEPTLDVEELDRLKRETIAEIVSSRDDDRYLASRALRLHLFGGHPYGRPSRGTVASVERITREDVVSFLDEHLVGGNVLLGVAGDIDDTSLDTTLGKAARRLPAREGPEFDVPAHATPAGIRVFLVDKPERTQAQMFVGHVGPGNLDPADLPLRVALTAFGGTFTSRLMREVRVKRGWSYGAYASLGRAKLPDALFLWTFPAVQDAPDCLRLVLGLYGELGRKGPSDEDMDFARDYMARSFALQQDTASARLTLRLREDLLGMPPDYYATFASRVRAVTNGQARDAVSQHVQDENLVIAITCTAKHLQEPLREVLGEKATIETIPYDSAEL